MEELLNILEKDSYLPVIKKRVSNVIRFAVERSEYEQESREAGEEEELIRIVDSVSLMDEKFGNLYYSNYEISENAVREDFKTVYEEARELKNTTEYDKIVNSINSLEEDVIEILNITNEIRRCCCRISPEDLLKEFNI